MIYALVYAAGFATPIAIFFGFFLMLGVMDWVEDKVRLSR